MTGAEHKFTVVACVGRQSGPECEPNFRLTIVRLDRDGGHDQTKRLAWFATPRSVGAGFCVVGR